MDLQSFGCLGISKALMVPAHCFLPMSSSSAKETGVPVRLSGLALHFCKLHCLLSLLSLYLLQKHSCQLILLLVGWRQCLFSSSDGGVSKGDGQDFEKSWILEERWSLGIKT